MNKFEELIESTLNEMSKYDDDKFSLDASAISEIVSDADSKNKLNDEEKDVLETELNDLMTTVYKKFKGDMKGADVFYKDAGKIGKSYGIIIKK